MLNAQKTESEFRDYAAADASDKMTHVREFYRLNHLHQTHDFVLTKKAQYLNFEKTEMSPWAALDFLNTLVDESDPDIALPQITHLLQSAEAIRADGHPDWFVLTGFIHDLGKVLCLWGEPQWAVVGDTFPTGCAYSPHIVYPEFFAANPDRQKPELQTQYGLYQPHCGLNQVHLSWGHDEYLYHLLRPYLPEEGLAMIRYHSFYSWHRAGDYDYLCNADDRRLLPWVQKFNPYDLYSKSESPPDLAALKPYYEDLLAKYLPSTLRF
jgi:inositol oxygenase